MTNQTFDRIARDVAAAKAALVVAKELLAAMREAGEDVTELTTEIHQLEVRLNRWEGMLQSRGIGV